MDLDGYWDIGMEEREAFGRHSLGRIVGIALSSSASDCECRTWMHRRRSGAAGLELDRVTTGLEMRSYLCVEGPGRNCCSSLYWLPEGL